MLHTGAKRRGAGLRETTPQEVRLSTRVLLRLAAQDRAEQVDRRVDRSIMDAARHEAGAGGVLLGRRAMSIHAPWNGIRGRLLHVFRAHWPGCKQISNVLALK